MGLVAARGPVTSIIKQFTASVLYDFPATTHPRLAQAKYDTLESRLLTWNNLNPIIYK